MENIHYHNNIDCFKRISAALVIFFVVILCRGIPLLAGEDVFLPFLDKGQAWDVMAEYRSFPRTDNRWSPSVLFHYTVSGETRAGDKEIDVRGEGDTGTGRISFRDGTYLHGVETSKRIRGKWHKRTLSFDEKVPVKTREAPFPFDWPVFPLRPGETAGFSAVIRLDDGLMAKRIIRQKVETVPCQELPDPVDLKGDMGPFFKVICVDDHGETLFVQYWAQGLPWPVYGENQDMRYWLVLE